MTYPPQQPGEQGPHGPPQGRPGQPWGEPPPEEQPGQFPQQPPGSFVPPPGPPPPGGGSGAPPSGGGGGKKKGLWAGVSVAAVIVVAALLVTGLAVPGWMLGSSGPQEVAQQLAEAYQKQDFATVKNDLVCTDAGRKAVDKNEKAFQKHNMTISVSLSGDPRIDGDRATQEANVQFHGGPFDGKPHHAKVTLKDGDGGWCIENFDWDLGSSNASSSSGHNGGSSVPGTSTSTGGGSHSGSGSSSTDAVPAVKKFAQAINDKDTDAAGELLCSNSDTPRKGIKSIIEKVVSKGFHVSITSRDQKSSGDSKKYALKVDNGNGSGSVWVTKSDDAEYCVSGMGFIS